MPMIRSLARVFAALTVAVTAVVFTSGCAEIFGMETNDDREKKEKNRIERTEEKNAEATAEKVETATNVTAPNATQHNAGTDLGSGQITASSDISGDCGDDC